MEAAEKELNSQGPGARGGKVRPLPPAPKTMPSPRYDSIAMAVVAPALIVGAVAALILSGVQNLRGTAGPWWSYVLIGAAVAIPSGFMKWRSYKEAARRQAGKKGPAKGGGKKKKSRR